MSDEPLWILHAGENIRSSVSFFLHFFFRGEADQEIFDKQQKNENNILEASFMLSELLNSSNIYFSGYDGEDKKLKSRRKLKHIKSIKHFILFREVCFVSLFIKILSEDFTR